MDKEKVDSNHIDEDCSTSAGLFIIMQYPNYNNNYKNQ